MINSPSKGMIKTCILIVCENNKNLSAAMGKEDLMAASANFCMFLLLNVIERGTLDLHIWFLEPGLAIFRKVSLVCGQFLKLKFAEMTTILLP